MQGPVFCLNSGMQRNLEVHLDYIEQLELFRKHGLQVESEEEALSTLRYLGFYSLAGYTKPFRVFQNPGSAEQSQEIERLIPGTNLNDILRIISFDFELSSLISDVLLLFEKAIKSQLAYTTGKTNPFFYMTLDYLDPRVPRDTHIKWLEKFDSNFKSNTDKDFITKFSIKSRERLPIWAAIEVMQFGTVTFLYSLLRHEHKVEISKHFGVDNTQLFYTYIEQFRLLRNLCAHGSRIWNTRFGREFPSLSEYWVVEDSIKHAFDSPKKSIYWRLVILIHLSQGNPFASPKLEKLRNTLFDLPEVESIDIRLHMGFPANWQTLDFWMSNT